MTKSPYDKLNVNAEQRGFFNVVVETPRGSRNKYNYDEELHVFKLRSILPAGASFPYDFAFVPGTRADDGDPLDVLLLIESPTFTGCLVEARLIGVVLAQQTVNGKVERNDRIVAVARCAHEFADLKSLKEFNHNLLKEIEHFFVSYTELQGKQFKTLGIDGPEAATKLVNKAIKNE